MPTDLVTRPQPHGPTTSPGAANQIPASAKKWPCGDEAEISNQSWLRYRFTVNAAVLSSTPKSAISNLIAAK